ncbi:membrane protein required for colicin V production [Humitalea rosea]|uniref:Membrane protein required for colicin V production n=1 Tax=Humitalea rosea TaxID=990373 RepID=A0A2W7I6J1_9PROT|nr:CvpA family protein [Humitalea rosea]PZW42274.1 membrane protein required for colicin V production [Humitalea rosea]
MTWVDIALLVVLALSALISFFRGFVAETLGVAAWVGAIALAFLTKPLSVAFLLPFIEPRWVAEVVAVGAVFLITLVFLKLLIAWISGHIQRSALGGVDRSLGVLFGLARGAFLAILAYIVAGLFVPATDRWPEAVREARALPHVADGAAWIADQMPVEYRPRLPDLPGRRVPTQEDLLRPAARSRT